MIIDLILDRQYNDSLISQGYTHANYPNGELVPLAYDPHKFYIETLGYGGESGGRISAAMDYGTEADVQNALCDYVIRNDYNPAICEYIRSVAWLV